MFSLFVVVFLAQLWLDCSINCNLGSAVAGPCDAFSSIESNAWVVLTCFALFKASLDLFFAPSGLCSWVCVYCGVGCVIIRVGVAVRL